MTEKQLITWTKELLSKLDLKTEEDLQHAAEELVEGMDFMGSLDLDSEPIDFTTPLTVEQIADVLTSKKGKI